MEKVPIAKFIRRWALLKRSLDLGQKVDKGRHRNKKRNLGKIPKVVGLVEKEYKKSHKLNLGIFAAPVR